MEKFRLLTSYEPKGDQPMAISMLAGGLGIGKKHLVLLGVTGSGKTFTMAQVIEKINRPTLIIAHNKTLAAQLYGEFKELFPDNAVEFFVSYYDYYQPEAYLPTSDTYIEKDAMVNDDIDRMRHSATMSVLERRDAIVVASVSCIYGIGSPEDYMSMHLIVEENMETELEVLEFVQSGQVLQGRVGNTGPLEVKPVQVLQVGQRRESIVGDVGARQVEPHQLLGNRG